MTISRCSIRTLLGGLLLLPLLGGCGFMERVGLLGSGIATCQEPQAYEAAAEIPPLQVPAGLDTPPARVALKIPTLDVPERKRAANVLASTSRRPTILVVRDPRSRPRKRRKTEPDQPLGHACRWPAATLARGVPLAESLPAAA
ncbi:MAG: hypothetical protein ACKO0U_10995 [Gammaproteobacteria bacterium]